MRLNNDIVVSSSRLLLVPYDAHHVPTYHGWMADPAIQEATASEPLTLEEEYENQVSWRTSGDKLTFILCLAADGNGNDEDSHGSASKNYGGLSLNDTNSAEAVAMAGQVDAADRMIGDINLFLTPWEEEEEEEDNRDKNDGGVEPTIRNHGQVSYVNGEIDIMIASHAHRRLGLGREAVATLLRYIHVHAHEMLAEYVAFTSTRLPTLSRPPGTSGDSGSDGTSGRQDASSDRQQRQQYMIKDLVAKISEGNQGSIALFKRLGFQQRGEVNYFGEMELVLESFGSEEHDDGGKESFRAAYREVRWDRSRL